MSKPSEVTAKLDALRTRVMAVAQKVLKEEMPLKVVVLSDLHEELLDKRSKKMHVVDLDTIKSYREDPKMQIPVNQVVMQAANRVADEIRDVLVQAGSLKTWVELSMPRMEDGNNFGVEVQMEVIEMINALYKSGRQTLANLMLYNRSRGKLLSNMRKRAHLDDYPASILTVDDVYFSMLIQHCFDLRNSIVVLQDTMMKNIEKLRKPKGDMQSVFVY
mmetsp:Transcript_15834/g.30615  ORF Transcript_15834/g.30615 Transcript_15834/m.30615 type:complete len:218 (+) Transcript_15834:138-791(+)